MGAAGTVGAYGKFCCSHELQWVVGSRGFRRLWRQVPLPLPHMTSMYGWPRPKHSQQPPGVVQNWSALQCSEEKTLNYVVMTTGAYASPVSVASWPQAGRGCHLGSTCSPPSPRGSREIPVLPAAYPPTHGGTGCHGNIAFGPWCERHLVQYLFYCTVRCIAHPV